LYTSSYLGIFPDGLGAAADAEIGHEERGI
jgi:hypothetical protein